MNERNERYHDHRGTRHRLPPYTYDVKNFVVLDFAYVLYPNFDSRLL